MSSSTPSNDMPNDQPQPTATDRLRNEFQSRQNVDDDIEHEIWTGGYSPKAMIGTWVVCGLITLVALSAAIAMLRDGMWWAILVGGIIVLWAIPLATLVFRRMSIRYRLTSQRLFHESGILKRRVDRIEAIDMDDVTYEQRLFERAVGCGTIRIVSSDRSHPNFVMPGIENVSKISADIDQARRTERVRRGIHIISNS